MAQRGPGEATALAAAVALEGAGDEEADLRHAGLEAEQAVCLQQEVAAVLEATEAILPMAARTD